MRSLENLPHDNVWVVGHLPKWATNIKHINYLPARRKFINIQRQLKYACEHEELSDNFIYFNDDFFVLNPVNKIQNYHRGLLDDHPFIDKSSSDHKKGGRSARNFLKNRGIKNPYSYEVHTPMVVNKHDFLEAINISDIHGVRPAFIRSIYGNLYDVKAEEIQDVKIFKTWETAENKFPDNNLISTNPRSWREGEVKKELKDKFPNPSIYEKEHYK